MTLEDLLVIATSLSEKYPLSTNVKLSDGFNEFNVSQIWASEPEKIILLYPQNNQNNRFK